MGVPPFIFKLAGVEAWIQVSPCQSSFVSVKKMEELLSIPSIVFSALLL